MPPVLNRRTLRRVPPRAVYVGRPTQWGNPFPVADPADTQAYVTAVEAYAHWLATQPTLRTAIRQHLADRPLICWCAPKPCHADILDLVANTDDPDTNLAWRLRHYRHPLHGEDDDVCVDCENDPCTCSDDADDDDDSDPLADFLRRG